MPIWIELVVSLLIVYGAVVTLAMMLVSRRMRLTQLLRLRAGRVSRLVPGKRKEENSDG